MSTTRETLRALFAGGGSLSERIAGAFPEGSLRQRVARGAFWSILGSALSQGFALLAAIASARMLGATGYGELGIVVSTVNLFSALATAGLGVTATRYVAEHRTADPARAARVIGMSAVVSWASAALVGVVLVLLAPWLASETLAAPHLAAELQIGALTMALSAVNGAQVGVLTGLEAFRAAAVGNVVRGAATFALVLAGLLLGGLRGAVIGYALGALLTVAVHAGIVRTECASRGIPIAWRPRREEMGLFWRFSLPALVAGISFTPATWWSNALLVNRTSYAENGVFGAARQWQSMVLFFTNAVANLGLPMLSSVLPERDGRKYRRHLALNFALTAGLAAAVAVPVVVASPWVMRLYGPEFQGRGLVLVWISASAVLMAANVSVGHAIWSLDASRAGVLLALARGAALVAFSYLLVDRGADGIALAWLAMGVVQTAIQVPFMAWLLRKQERDWGGARG